MKALDLFSGAGGWDVAATELGWDVDGVEIMPEAKLTRSAAGLKTVADDVRDVDPVPGEYDAEIASPPCQTFSPAGNGAGRAALDAVLLGVAAYRNGATPRFADLAALTGDDRTALVLEPLRVALAARPTFIAWEQVPTVLPVWEACADVLRQVGYSVATGNLNAEQYGVPQTRKRALLVARRDGATVELPTPAHSRYYPRTPERLDEGVRPWVSMAEALGWERGTEVRRTFGKPRYDYPGREASVWKEAGQPAPTVTSKARSWVLRTTNARPNTAHRPASAPAPTLAFGKARPEWDLPEGETRPVTLAEAATLQTFPEGYPFQGSRSKQFLQVGNAVPPLLARAVLAACVA